MGKVDDGLISKGVVFPGGGWMGVCWCWHVSWCEGGGVRVLDCTLEAHALQGFAIGECNYDALDSVLVNATACSGE